MSSTPDFDPRLLVQPLAPGVTIPLDFNRRGLFLLNFGEVLATDVWDDYGNKELGQANRLRSLAFHISAMADAMEQLGLVLKAYPDADDFEIDEYEQTWEEICVEMQSTFDGGYSSLADLVDELTEAAAGDFMN